MDDFNGFEPRVGEVLAVRTFRIGSDGRLFPLYSRTPWTEGTNNARCRVITRAAQCDHVAPEPDCTCGFYAYADAATAADEPRARHVLGVVSCWGRIITGTRGLRAQHARVEALWLSDRVPIDLVAQVAANYPDTVLHTDREAMLADFPPTPLASYEPAPPPRSRGVRMLLAAWLLTAVAVGCLPGRWLWERSDIRLVWLAEVLSFGVVSALLYSRARNGRDRRDSVFGGAVLLWLLAPFGGPAGLLLLRLPLMQFALLCGVRWWQLVREAGRFPSPVKAARPDSRD